MSRTKKIIDRHSINIHRQDHVECGLSKLLLNHLELHSKSYLQLLSELDRMDKENKSHFPHVINGFIKAMRLRDIAAM